MIRAPWGRNVSPVCRHLAWQVQRRALTVLATNAVAPQAVPQLPRLRGLLLDAAGTLLYPSEPAAAVYHRYACKYGCRLSETEILTNFRRCASPPVGSWPTRWRNESARGHWHATTASKPCRPGIFTAPSACRAFDAPWVESVSRYVGDGRPFWCAATIAAQTPDHMTLWKHASSGTTQAFHATVARGVSDRASVLCD